MRNLKKILAMALTVLMVVGSFAMTATAAFDDVTDYQEAIEVMAVLGIAAGKSETEFAPDDDVTREEMALWIAKIMTGKVATDYVTNNFLGAVENLTAFADLDEDNYVGAINYAANNGIIVGTSATTFEPTEAIKIQDVFAMVVRMLGYGSTAMNNNYPWSFIDKAISLGLDADLPADYSNEAVASRGETMQILYNALTALKSDGSTLGYDFFGLEKATVVITGTSKGNMYTGAELVTKTVDDEDYVAFSVLNANGTVAADKATYYVLKSEFGIEGDAQLYVGNSYVIRTVDGFASFLTCESATTPVVLSQDEIVGASSSSGAVKYVTVDGKSYKLVDNFSNFVTGNDGEIIFMRADGKRTEVYDAASYVMDADLNILAEDGSILLHWVTTFGVGETPAYANLNGMYLYQLADGTYIQPNDFIWSQAKKVSVNTSEEYGFTGIENSYSQIEQWDAYSDTVLYDDDNDGDYDRAIYYQYSLGRLYSKNVELANVNYPVIRVQNTITQTSSYSDQEFSKYLDERYNSTDKEVLKSISPANTKIYTADGEELAFADISGKFILYTYIPLYKTIIVKDILEEQTGLVTGIDLVNKTITLNGFGANIITGVVAGETYNLGKAKLNGGRFEDIQLFGGEYLANILGKNVNFVEKDGNVLAVINAIDKASYMVYVNDAPGYTTMGYKNILAYYDPAANRVAATQAVVTINAVDNYWYSGFVNSGVAGSTSVLTEGALLKATKDALGNYDVTVQALTEAANGITLTVNNGVVSYNGNAFAAASDTVFIIWDKTTNGFKTFTGIPADGATVTGITAYFVSSDDLVYLVGEDIDTSRLSPAYDPWGGFAQTSTIIYADTHTETTMKASNAYTYGMGINVGMTYTYNKAIDFINGGFVSNLMSDYNFNARLIAGNFYEVKNGYVVKLITPAEYATYGINTGLLLKANSTNSALGTKYQYSLVTEYADKDTTTAAVIDYDSSKLLNKTAVLPILYKFTDSTETNVWDDSLVDVLKSAKTGVAADLTEITSYNYAYPINDTVGTDGLDTAVKVYYYANGADNKLDSKPVFIGASATVEAKAYSTPDKFNYNVNLYGWDDNNGVSSAWFRDFATKNCINVYKDATLLDSAEIAIDTVVGSYVTAQDAVVTADNGSYTFYITVKDPLVGTVNASNKYQLNASWIDEVPNSNGAIRKEEPVDVVKIGTHSTQDGMAVYTVTVTKDMVYAGNNEIHLVLSVEKLAN